MKKIYVTLAICMLFAVSAMAQSSGNFGASGTNAACAIGAGGSFSGGTGVNLLTTTVKTSNGNGVTLDIRPTLVTGLFTDTKISATIPTASADVGIQVCVTIDGGTAGLLSPSCVTYNQRFQQLSSQLFSVITECALSPTTIACTTNADCSSVTDGFCNITNPTATPPSGFCATANPLCNLDLILSTLSANSFDYIAQVPNGSHNVQVTWSVIGAGASAGSDVASCVGPGVLTVTQVHNFQQDSSLSF
jgi:hypothetical protein